MGFNPQHPNLFQWGARSENVRATCFIMCATAGYMEPVLRQKFCHRKVNRKIAKSDCLIQLRVVDHKQRFQRAAVSREAAIWPDFGHAWLKVTSYIKVLT